MARHGHPKRLSHRQRRVRYFLRRAAWVVVVAGVLAAGAWADRAGLFGRAPKGDWLTYHDQQFKVVRVIDGDTLDVNHPDGRYSTTRIRLWGVDTPETVKPDTPVQHFGREATRYTRAAALDKTVTLELYPLRTRGQYNRLLAYVIGADGTNLNEAIIATGHGYADPRRQFAHPLQRRFEQAQRAAMKARRGLWKDVTEDDLPYYYRGKLKLPGPRPPTKPAP